MGTRMVIGDTITRLLGDERAGCVWRSLPLMFLASCAVDVALIPSVALWSAGLTSAAPIAAGVCVGPIWAGAVAAADLVATGGPWPTTVLTRRVPRFAWRGIGLGLPPGMVMSSLVTSEAVLRTDPGNLVAGAVASVDAGAIVLVALGLVYVFSLGTTADLGVIQAWKAALQLAAHAPRQTLAAVCVAGSTVAGMLALEPSIAVVAFGPAAVATAAFARGVALRCAAVEPLSRS
jgi:hypothetical protein